MTNRGEGGKPAGGGDPTALNFRPDIEGLRGVAVGLVVLYHAGLLGVSGGFIGVDVFFVISGLLITGLLVRDVEQTGRVGFLAFYARRFRRLAPAAAVVLLVTTAATIALASPINVAEFLLDGSAAALSVVNVRFAASASDYFAAVSSPSPFLHFWSLAVEEQFYLLWPALIALVVSRLGRHSLRTWVRMALLLVVIVSFATNLLVTESSVSWAFYSLPTRAWELAAGGLLALSGPDVRRLGNGWAAGAGAIGLVMIVGSAIALDDTVAYPGSAALWPVIGTLGVLVASGRGPARLLEGAPLRFLGRISYSLYLWHWPLLILPTFVSPAPLEPWASAGLVVVAVVVAALSWRFVETPFRAGRSGRLRPSPNRVVAVGLAGLLALAISIGGLALASVSPPASASTETPSPSDLGLGPTATHPESSLATDPATAEPEPSNYALPADIRPTPAGARADTTEAKLRADGCMGLDPATVPPPCTYGDTNGSFVVALVGDSHAAQWFTALDAIASARHWRLETFTKVRCPFLDVPVLNIALKREYTECEAWNRAVVERLNAHPADLVLISTDRDWISPMDPALANPESEGASEARLVAQIPGRVAVIVDTPIADKDVPACLAANVDDIRVCTFSRAIGEANAIGVREAIVAARTGAGLINLNAIICPGDPCQPVIDRVLIFRDNSHLTATFSMVLAPDLAAAIDLVLAP